MTKINGVLSCRLALGGNVLTGNSRLISSAFPSTVPPAPSFPPSALTPPQRVAHTMKRTTSTSRTPSSPTATTYSGISNYQGSTFQSKSPPSQSASYPPLDSTVIARAHFDELYKYLASYLAKGVFQTCRAVCCLGTSPSSSWFLQPP